MEGNQRTIEGIQYLRGIAAFLVVGHHMISYVPTILPAARFGYVGVDIFFVISGFVMAYSTRQVTAQRNLRERLTDAGDFMYKRLVRILPLYYLALLWTSRRPLMHGQQVPGLGLDFLFFPHPNAEYPDALWPTVLQGWTLNYEMFFYLLFALSLLLWSLRAYTVIPLLVLLSLLGYVSSLNLPAPDIHTTGGALFQFTTRDITLEFCAGIIAHGLWARGTFDRLPVWVHWTILAVAGVALGALANNNGEDFAHRGALFAVPAALVVLSSIGVSVATRIGWLQLLGDASYAIYLFHWASFGAITAIAAWLARNPLGVLSVPALIVTFFACAIVSGILIHKLIEKPLLRAIRSLHLPLQRRATPATVQR